MNQSQNNLVDTIIELTSKISGIESKFEQFEKHTL